MKAKKKPISVNGGKREGSGRKPTGRVALTIRVTKKTERFLRRQAILQDKKIGELIDALLL